MVKSVHVAGTSLERYLRTKFSTAVLEYLEVPQREVPEQARPRGRSHGTGGRRRPGGVRMSLIGKKTKTPRGVGIKTFLVLLRWPKYRVIS
jgi:hypothetical protein